MCIIGEPQPWRMGVAGREEHRGHVHPKEGRTAPAKLSHGEAAPPSPWLGQSLCHAPSPSDPQVLTLRPVPTFLPSRALSPLLVRLSCCGFSPQNLKATKACSGRAGLGSRRVCTRLGMAATGCGGGVTSQLFLIARTLRPFINGAKESLNVALGYPRVEPQAIAVSSTDPLAFTGGRTWSSLLCSQWCLQWGARKGLSLWLQWGPPTVHTLGEGGGRREMLGLGQQPRKSPGSPS